MFCKNCGTTISSDSKFCTNCGSQVTSLSSPTSAQAEASDDTKTRVKTKARPDNYVPGWIVLVVFIVIGTFIWFQATNSGSESSAPTQTAAPDTTSSQKWYEGGTLHKANILQWQQASQRNRLATAADFVAALAENGALKDRFQAELASNTGLQQLAESLEACINKASQKFPNADDNKKMFSNQSVAGIASACVLLMGWGK